MTTKEKRRITFKSSSSNIYLDASTPQRDLPSYFSPTNEKYSAIHNESIDSPQHFEVPLERFREISDILPRKMRREIERSEKSDVIVRIEEQVYPTNKNDENQMDEVKRLRFDENSINDKIDALKCERSQSRIAMILAPKTISSLNLNFEKSKITKSFSESKKLANVKKSSKESNQSVRSYRSNSGNVSTRSSLSSCSGSSSFRYSIGSNTRNKDEKIKSNRDLKKFLM